MAVILLVIVLISLVTEGISASCSKLEFPCNDGSCIDKSRWCDIDIDCRDESDELYCRTSRIMHNPNKCNDDFFLCHDGSCIPIVGKCDGVFSCRDYSDEEECGITTRGSSSTEHASEMEITTTSTRRPQTEALHFATSTFYPNISRQHVAEVKVSKHSNIQSDTALDEEKSVKSVYNDMTMGFVKIDSRYFIHEKSKAEAWLLSTRDHEYGWGDETARAVTALYLSNEDLLKKSTEETMLMIKQLHLKLSIALMKNQTKELPLTELASFINALYATCDNPRNFHGYDLVDILRQRTDVAQALDKFVSPLVYLTLCIGNLTTLEDVRRLQNYSASSKAYKIDMNSLVSLAATCISSTTDSSAFLHVGPQIVRRLVDVVSRQGLPQNIYELSLVAQALNEGRINQEWWNRSDALHHISSMQQENGSFGDILSTYYTLPVLSSKSLVDLAGHCYSGGKDLVPLDAHMKGNENRQYVTYSLYFGEPVEVSQTLRIKVGLSTNLMDIMRIAESINPLYRFKFDIARGKPHVYSIGGTVNDAEQGLYWNLYLSMRNATGPENFQLFDGDIRSFIPTANDHVTFWFKKVY